MFFFWEFLMFSVLKRHTAAASGQHHRETDVGLACSLTLCIYSPLVCVFFVCFFATVSLKQNFQAY